MERLFGALKMRFRWISKAIEYKDIETLGYAVKVAAILHNRLLEYDNFDKFDWETMDPNRNDFEDEETEEEQQEIGERTDSVQQMLHTVEDLPGAQDLSDSITNLVADLPVHATVKQKKRLEMEMKEVEEVEEEVNPIADGYSKMP